MVNKMYMLTPSGAKYMHILFFEELNLLKLDQIYIKRINSSFTKKEIHISHYLVCCGKEE